MEKENKKRFVLVHGLCHGPWIWYKVKTQLVAAGHSVVAVDLAASGINKTRLEEIQTLKDYAKPLLDILSSVEEDKVSLVLIAWEEYQFLSLLTSSRVRALLLSSWQLSCPTQVTHLLMFTKRSVRQEDWLDTVFGTYGKSGRPLEFNLFGPNFMATYLYQLSPPEDLTLAKMLVRVNPLVTDNLAGTKSFSEEGYGSVTRIYIVCGEDLAVPEDYQRWMINNFPVKEVMEIKDADHMAMFSTPRELCALLLEIAVIYA